MWIARDKDGTLFMYENKPAKDNESFIGENGYDEEILVVREDLFPEVTWKNSPKELRI